MDDVTATRLHDSLRSEWVKTILLQRGVMIENFALKVNWKNFWH
ncbi:MAG: hypothetical protein ILNGONEN_00207 [Syntrophorhabdaceae bacterium]|nr:hypothetical protein [Syntrophorhabdaceae bacterium]